jgi:hypothetical protein
MPQSYEDFIIQVSKNPFEMPAQSIQVIRARDMVFPTELIGINLHLAAAKLNELDQLTIDGPSLRELGKELFEQVFEPGEVRPLYYEARGSLAGKNGVALRIRIVPMGAASAGDSFDLRGLPWEYLWRPSNQCFMVLEPTCDSITRSFSKSPACTDLPLVPPLRMLSVIANPSTGIEIDVEKERKMVLDAIQDAGLKMARCHPNDPLASQGGIDLVVTFLDEVVGKDGMPHKASREALKAYLTDPSIPQPHILHFGCHGGREDNPPGEGILLLEKDPAAGKTQGNQDELPARVLLPWLAAAVPALRLVVLNACATAGPARPGKNYHSMAEVVMRAGVPAAVAMQFDIPVKTALDFTRSFYTALFKGTLKDGLPLDEAMTRARDALSGKPKSDSPHWGIPVLYLNPGGVEPFKIITKGEEAKMMQLKNLSDELTFVMGERDRLAQQQAGGMPGWAQAKLVEYDQKIIELKHQINLLG